MRLDGQEVLEGPEMNFKKLLVLQKNITISGGFEENPNDGLDCGCPGEP
jgi:hypothetical protein